jgi:hypothetical protein
LHCNAWHIWTERSDPPAPAACVNRRLVENHCTNACVSQRLEDASQHEEYPMVTRSTACCRAKRHHGLRRHVRSRGNSLTCNVGQHLAVTCWGGCHPSHFSHFPRGQGYISRGQVHFSTFSPQRTKLKNALPSEIPSSAVHINRFHRPCEVSSCSSVPAHRRHRVSVLPRQAGGRAEMVA